MMARTAEVLGRRRPRIIRVPVLTPRLSSSWVALVKRAPPRAIGPLGFDDAVRAAVA
jgi:hypothetical protein